MTYQPADTCYDSMTYRRTGLSGLLLSAMPLGISAYAKSPDAPEMIVFCRQ